MRKLETKEVKPCNHNVLISVIFQEEVDEDGVFVGGGKQATKTTSEFYHGLVEGVGGEADIETECPGIEVGDQVIINQLSGCTVPTWDKYCKLVRGYDIVAISKDENMEIDSIKPTGDRVLVKILEEGAYDEDGVYIGESGDPREKQTQRGTLLAVGPAVKGDYEIGSTIYFDPYCGNMIVNDKETKLKTLNSFDILFTL